MATTETSSAAQSITSHSQIVVIPQMEQSVRRFTGQAVHQDLERFLEDLEAASTSQLTSSSQACSASLIFGTVTDSPGHTHRHTDRQTHSIKTEASRKALAVADIWTQATMKLLIGFSVLIAVTVLVRADFMSFLKDIQGH
ncbi:hypothetical protein RRG08_013910 [Elysia crispata]|uniref:Uncharacterized protein n=1 Tax=Elysia crispata TaxID=231223 RepID=A0AAE0Z903_9GAST|nr:hypothetical protein RRG08_013910 [Elysia crispata]